MLTINAGGTLTNEGGLDNNGDGTLTISEGGGAEHHGGGHPHKYGRAHNWGTLTINAGGDPHE